MAGRLLFIFLIIVALLMIVQAIFGVASSIYWAISEFLFNSRYGFIALIFLMLSAFFFYASSRTYPQVKEKGRIIDAIKPFLKIMDNGFSKKNKKNNMSKLIKSNSSLTINNQNEIEIDLSELDMQGVFRNLAIAINKPNPVFFKGWGNRRLELDVERVYIIKDYIEAVRSAGESFINLQADVILSYEKIQRLVQINRNDLIKKLRESELEIEILETEYQARADRLRIDIKNLEAVLLEKLADVEQINAQTQKILSDIETTRMEIEAEIKIKLDQTEANIKIMEDESAARIKLNQEKSDAEIYVMKLKAKDTSKLSNQKARVLDKIIEEMKLNNIRPVEVYLLIKLLETSNTDDFVDFDNRIKQMNEQLEKMKIENDKSRAEARQANARADEIEAQTKQNIKDLYK